MELKNELLASHKPVLANEIKALWRACGHPELDEKPLSKNEHRVYFWPAPPKPLLYVDATLGEAGHAKILLEQQPCAHLLGIDADAQMLERGCYFLQQALGPKKFSQQCRLVQQRFSDYFSALAPDNLQADLILFDLGISLFHYGAGRGFSFRPQSPEEPLDMRLDPNSGSSAAELLQNLNEAALADIFWHYGELHNARQIAQAIVRQRQKRELQKAQALANFLCQFQSGPPKKERRQIHPATRVFQALRIAVNDELGQLQRSLPLALRQLRPGGILAVISFHSLEDRVVKKQFRTWQEQGQGQNVYKKARQAPYNTPLASERSAKLRVLRRMH